ncbi:MAG: flavodoxin family protein [Candidatus Magasanikbacteria bacterium]
MSELLSKKQKKLCDEYEKDLSDLRATFLNCTLKPNPRESHTRGVIDISKAIMDENDVQTEVVRPVDYDIAPGVRHDMTDHGFEVDEWPEVHQKVMNSDILVLCTPIWLGDKSSVCTRVIERLYATSTKTNEKGQYSYYGKVGGTLITGNEDGLKHCAMNILYSLSHLGFTVPPQVDAGWIGEVGPGPSYKDEDSGAQENDFTNRNTTFMTWNMLHFAKMLKDQGGIPNHGNVKEDWDAGCDFDFPNPEHR